MRRRIAAGLWIAAAWTILAVFFGTSLWLNYIATGREARFGASLQISLVEWWIWALLTPLPLWLARRWPLARRPRAAHVGLHLAAGAGVALAKVLLERAARTWLFGVTPYLLPSSLALHMLIYWALVALAHAAAYYRQSRERELHASQMEARLQEARLDALDSQLRPHFLFNALNTIAETVHEDPERADRMIASLGDLLRASLDSSGHTTPLSMELSLVERYLAIQQARYGDRLRVEIDVPPELGARRVPRLLLQPLVENAVQHGVGSRPEGGLVAIRARLSAGALALTVEDDGAGAEAGRTAGDPSGGVGLSNTRARLDVLYGGRATMALGPRAGGGTATTITIPASDT
jgi:hypothetical protein